MKNSPQTTNTVVELFNMENKDEIDDAIGKFSFSNGTPFHVAHSNLYNKVEKARSSHAPIGKMKVRASILDKNYSEMNILMVERKVA